MSREDVVAVAVRLFVVFTLLTLLRAVPEAVRLLKGPDGAAFGGLLVGALAATAIVCALLWYFPLTIARKFLPVLSEPRSEHAIGASVALSLGIMVIGLWLLAHAVVDFSYWLALLLRSRQVELATGTPVDWSPEQVANAVATIVQAIVGLALILGSSGIRRFVYRYRYGSTEGAP